MALKRVTVNKPKPQEILQAALQRCGEGSPDGMVVDVFDMADPDIPNTEGRTRRSGPGVCRSDYRVYVPPVGNAVDQVVRKVVQAAYKRGKIRLIRFHGHGTTGYQSVWGGPLLQVVAEGMTEVQSRRVIRNPALRVAISYWNLPTITGALMQLSRHFTPDGEVWLMGCQVGEGREGRQLVHRLAILLGVVVRAGEPLQYASTEPAAWRMNYTLEGKVVVGRPIVDPWAE